MKITEESKARYYKRKEFLLKNHFVYEKDEKQFRFKVQGTGECLLAQKFVHDATTENLQKRLAKEFKPLREKVQISKRRAETLDIAGITWDEENIAQVGTRTIRRDGLHLYKEEAFEKILQQVSLQFVSKVNEPKVYKEGIPLKKEQLQSDLDGLLEVERMLAKCCDQSRFHSLEVKHCIGMLTDKIKYGMNLLSGMIASQKQYVDNQ